MAGGKTVIFTGASKAIGAAVAHAFLDDGYNAVATSRSISRAGIAKSSNFALVSTNLKGFLFITQLAVNRMLRQHAGGSVTSITASLVDNSMEAASASVPMITKGGPNAITRSLALEYAKNNIRFNAAEPGQSASDRAGANSTGTQHSRSDCAGARYATPRTSSQYQSTMDILQVRGAFSGDESQPKTNHNGDQFLPCFRHAPWRRTNRFFRKLASVFSTSAGAVAPAFALTKAPDSGGPLLPRGSTCGPRMLAVHFCHSRTRQMELRFQCFDSGHSISSKVTKLRKAKLSVETRQPRSDNYGKSNGELVKIKGSLISVVDDDESVRESLPDLLREMGFRPMAFSSAEEFLSSDSVSQTQCLILDIAMPGMSGPDLQQELARRQQKIPIIFITASRSASVRSRLLKQGAVECLFKPFTDSALLDALSTALRKS